MNELAGFSLQPSQTPLPVAAVVAVGKWEALFSFPLFHSLFSAAGNNSSSKQTPWRNKAHTTVNSLRASAILATCAGFLCCSPA